MWRAGQTARPHIFKSYRIFIHMQLPYIIYIYTYILVLNRYMQIYAGRSSNQSASILSGRRCKVFTLTWKQERNLRPVPGSLLGKLSEYRSGQWWEYIHHLCVCIYIQGFNNGVMCIHIYIYIFIFILLLICIYILHPIYSLLVYGLGYN